MMGRRDRQRCLFGAKTLPHRVPPDSFYGRMAQVSDVLFADDDLQEMYCPDSGRPNLPPSFMCGVMLLRIPTKSSTSHAVHLWMVVLALVGLLLNHIVLKGERAAFIMELPLYHAPNWRTIGLEVRRHSLAFLRKAGSLIFLVSIVVWALMVLPTGDMESSILASIGRSLEPLGRLMGLDWRLMVALVTSFVAKENSIATLGVLFGAAEDAGLPVLLARSFAPAVGLAFLIVQMLFIPCVASVAVLRQEAGSWRWALLKVALLLAVSFLCAILAHQVATIL